MKTLAQKLGTLVLGFWIWKFRFKDVKGERNRINMTCLCAFLTELVKKANGANKMLRTQNIE
jgi:hypothetical protein